MGKYFSQLTIAFAVAYIVVTVIDKKTGITNRIVAALPSV